MLAQIEADHQPKPDDYGMASVRGVDRIEDVLEVGLDEEPGPEGVAIRGFDVALAGAHRRTRSALPGAECGAGLHAKKSEPCPIIMTSAEIAVRQPDVRKAVEAGEARIGGSDAPAEAQALNGLDGVVLRLAAFSCSTKKVTVTRSGDDGLFVTPIVGMVFE